MGVTYEVLPVDADMARHLADRHITPPPPKLGGRDPTPVEVLDMVQILPGVEAEFRWPKGDQGLRITLFRPSDGAWAAVQFPAGVAMDTPARLSLEAGWPDLFATLLQRLVPTTGPLAVFPSTGEGPMVVAVGLGNHRPSWVPMDR